MSTVTKKTARWADESADASPDFRPAAAPRFAEKVEFVLEEQRPKVAPTKRYCLFIDNLASICAEEDLGQFLLDGGCFTSAIRMARDRDGRAKGSAFADCKDEESFKKGMTLSGGNLLGKKVFIQDEALPREDRRRDKKPIDRRRDMPSTPVTRSAPVQPAAVVERKPLNLIPRSVPLENRHFTAVQPVVAAPVVAAPVVAAPVVAAPAVAAPVAVPVAAPVAAPVVGAPVVPEEEFVSKPSKKKVAASVAAAPKAAPTAVKNRFARLVETDSDPQ